MYVIYLDVLFLINFIMDFMIFLIATMLLNKPIKMKRLLVAALLATLLYCMLIICPVLQELPYGCYTLAVPIIPILYYYKPTRIKLFAKYYLLCTAVAALMGGTTFSLWYMFGIKESISHLSIFVLIGIAVGIGTVVYLSFYMIRKRLIMPYFEYEVALQYQGKQVQFKGILDTGNCLYTPISHRPVLVVTYETMKKVLSKEQIDMVETCHYNVQEMFETHQEGISQLIPFNSVGCKSGMLWGIESDRLVICKSCFKRCLSHCIVGISFEPLFSDQAYEGLLHPDFIMSEGE